MIKHRARLGAVGYLTGYLGRHMTNDGKQGGNQSGKQGRGQDKKAQQYGVTPQSVDFNDWYNEVVRKADLADHSPVAGAMVVKPYGTALWERIQRDLDDRFKADGHQNLLFPTLIPMDFIMKEADHVEGFAPELFTVSKIGTEELAEPYVMRPTSETIVGHMWSGWLNSYRDLPFLHNQWGSVFRAELRTKPFLRTSEFFWQEGHTAHATEEEARAEVRQQLDVYHAFCRDVLALPVVRGEKTASERFAGAENTYSIEGMMRDGKACNREPVTTWARTSAGLSMSSFRPKSSVRNMPTPPPGASSRIIGALIMTHGDDFGLIMPPNIAPIQVVIVPVGRKDDFAQMVAEGQQLAAELRAQASAPMWMTVRPDQRLQVQRLGAEGCACAY
ncbi:aminoacyl--tRNA ligase-related protein [Deinococcus radiophilus]|uniref:aminoacyl--tRNA ligase-related protein n=1 Tax=Deinococcus radiophilus TaxID=32062 RepID=UPI00361302F6